MSKMPVDRDDKQKDIFRRFGIPKLRAEDAPKPKDSDTAETETDPKRKGK